MDLSSQRKLAGVFGVGALLTASLVAGVSPAQADDSVRCTGVLTGTYDNVVVPRDAACTLTDATVRGDVVARGRSYLQATNTSVAGNVTSKNGQTVFIDTGSHVGGNILGDKTAQVFVFNSMVEGNIKVSEAAQQVQVCGTLITKGNVEVTNSARRILFGDSGEAECLGNNVSKGSVLIKANFTDAFLFVRGNRIPGGSLRVLDNKGPAEKRVENNRGGQKLVCNGNQAPFFSSGNTGWEERQGQCAVN